MFAPVNCAVLSVWLLTKFTKRIETWERSRDIFIRKKKPPFNSQETERVFFFFLYFYERSLFFFNLHCAHAFLPKKRGKK